jgi:hypothetical protein
MLTLPEINEVLVRYGRGELDADAAAAALHEQPRVRAERDPHELAATLTLTSALIAARATRVLTTQQYQRLGEAVQNVHEPPDDEESQPGGDAYHHHATPRPPNAYLNPGAPVIPEAYRNPDSGRRPPRPEA